MDYRYTLKALETLQNEDGSYAVHVTVELDAVDAAAAWIASTADPSREIGPSTIEISTTLQTLPAMTQGQWEVWAVQFLQSRLPGS
ncbi:hypothetical protein [Gluconobacter oxydans]|uniref:hypothetical protein n=1 Tax=Gluconobacter oxydans TaxID=442 RepID=UPI0039EBAA0D